MTRPNPAEADNRGARAQDQRPVRRSAWNLLLLVPLLMLVTSVFNQDSPRLLGMPFFYWYQFAWVPVGVVCVLVVYVKTSRGER